MTYSEPLISKEKFVSIIDTIRYREELASKIDDVCIEYRALLKDDLPYSGNIIIGGADEIIELLGIIMKDEGDNIGYFCWELNFGKDYEPGCITHNDKEIDISTAEKLYDYLVEVHF